MSRKEQTRPEASHDFQPYPRELKTNRVNPLGDLDERLTPQRTQTISLMSWA